MRKLLAALVLMGGAAQGADLPQVALQGALQGSWRVAVLAGQPVTAEITISVDGTQVTGRAACNRYFGTLGSESLFSAMGATRMACEGDLMALEAQFLAAMATVDGADLDKGTLRLMRSGDVVIVARPD